MFTKENPKAGINKAISVEYVPLSSIKLAKRNPKKHADDPLAASMLRFGFVAPPIVNERTGRMVAGHARIASLRKAKAVGRKPPERVLVQGDEWLIPVIRGVSFENETEAEAYLLADNQLAMLGGWDDAELDQILKDLAVSSGLEGTGFADLFELPVQEDDPTSLIDHAAELQKKWETRLGQLWTISGHRLLCGDCTSESDVRRLMNGKRAALFATDPPYLVEYNGTGHPHRWSDSEETKRRKNKNWSDKYSDVDSPKLGEALYDAFITTAINIAIDAGAPWYCWHASRRQALLESVWNKHGTFVHQQIIWAKDRPILTRSWFMWQHEPCFFGWV